MPTAGPIARNVRASVEELAADRGLSMRRLSALLEELGRTIPPLGLSRILKDERRVDVDELVALALALGVNPNALLFPRAAGRDAEVELTPEVRHRSFTVWAWADGIAPLPAEVAEAGAIAINTPGDKWHDWVTHARPDYTAPEPHPAVAEMLSLKTMIETVLAEHSGATRAQTWAMWRDIILRRFRLIGIQLEELVDQLDRETMTATGVKFYTAGAHDEIRGAVGEVRQPAIGFAEGTEDRYRANVPPPGPHGTPTSRIHAEVDPVSDVDPLDPFRERGQ